MSWEASAKSLETSFDYRFKNIQHLYVALTHKSFRYEAGEKHGQDNEKLEFLGDAVLDLVLSDLLMKAFAQDQEGALSKKRASLVNEESLAIIAKNFKLDECLRLGKGERLSNGLQKPRILACCFEAILGAIYVDGGFDQCFTVIQKIYEPQFPKLATEPDYASDFKTRLQERTQELFKKVPRYVTDGEQGPDHDKEFEVYVELESEILARGKGRNKKSAEQNAAQNALQMIEMKFEKKTEEKI